MSESNYAYKAFISYSKDPDRHIAKKLEDEIERFGTGWHRLSKQKLYIFRDVTEMVPANDLTLRIEEALDKSEFLIVLSQKKLSGEGFNWVNKEVEYFISSCEKRGHDPADYIILVITDGEVAWDRVKNQWDFNITNVIPHSLREIFKHEPLYVDLRLLNDDSGSQSRKNQVLREAIIPIVAKLLYKKPSEIQNQIIRLQRYVIGFVVIILILISGISVYALIQKNYAVQNEVEAKNQAQIAKKNEQEAIRQEKEATRQKKLAEKNEAEAVKQENIAKENEAEAIKQENLAKENEAEAIKQKNIAKENEAEAIKQKGIAKENEEIAKFQERKTDTINKLIEAENLALKASDFFKSLNDTLVSNKSVDEEKLARNQKDSINKAFALFKDYEGLKKLEHRNKLENLYTSDILSYVFFTGSKYKLESMYDRVYQTTGNKTVVFNLNGQIFDTNSSQYIFNQKENFVEATPVEGTNIIAYSNYDKNIKLVDLDIELPYQVALEDITGRDVITDAFKKSEDVLILNSKNGVSYQMQFDDSKKTFTSHITNDKLMLPAQFGNKPFDVSYSGGKLSLITDSDTTLLNDVSSYCIDERDGSIFWGTPNGEVNEYRVFEKNPGNSIISVKDRINEILIDQNNQILAVHVGANQLLLFAKFDWGYTKIYQEIIGRRINDICLGNDGHIYVLYDRNRLVFWPVKSALFQGKEGKLVNQ